MVCLLAAAECTLDTDFALLYALQETGAEPPASQTYAASAPGAVAMVCGTKYARLHVRTERWDGPPPPPDEAWEDMDELPFEVVPGGGPLRVSGFEPAGGEGLPVADLCPAGGRARVQVLAAGRHRYGYSDGEPPAEPERWLLRLFPDPGARDALAGPPRRLAGPLPFARRPAGWWAAHEAWRTAGWSSHLSSLPAFRLLQEALTHARGPATPEEVLAQWQRYLPALEHRPAPDWDTDVMVGRQPYPSEPPPEQALGQLAAAAGMPAVRTVGDALTCLRRLGLLLVAEGREQGRLVLHPAPRPVWEVLRMPAEDVVRRRQAVLHDQHGHLGGDVDHLVRWAPGGVLSAPLGRIAVRLAVPLPDVVGALQAKARWGLRTSPELPFDADGSVGPGTVVTVRQA